MAFEHHRDKIPPVPATGPAGSLLGVVTEGLGDDGFVEVAVVIAYPPFGPYFAVRGVGHIYDPVFLGRLLLQLQVQHGPDELARLAGVLQYRGTGVPCRDHGA